jgi:hypothetical protein
MEAIVCIDFFTNHLMAAAEKDHGTVCIVSLPFLVQLEIVLDR